MGYDVSQVAEVRIFDFFRRLRTTYGCSLSRCGFYSEGPTIVSDLALPMSLHGLLSSTPSLTFPCSGCAAVRAPVVVSISPHALRW